MEGCDGIIDSISQFSRVWFMALPTDENPQYKQWASSAIGVSKIYMIASKYNASTTSYVLSEGLFIWMALLFKYGNRLNESHEQN